MGAGSLLAVAAVLVVAGAATPATFAAGWLLAGLAMSAVLYGPAFAAVTGWFEGESRVRALTALTVVGGLASTVFAPSTAWLEGQLGWRGAYAVLAGVLALTVPAHWFGLRAPWPRHDLAGRHAGPAAVLTSRPFLALAGAFTLTALSSTAAVVHLVPLLRERGVGLGTASTVLALGGLGQVVGRVGYGRFAARVGVGGRVVAVLAALAVTTALLGLVEAMYAVVLVVLVAGTARGALTLVRATVVADRWGVRHYAQLTGVLSLPVALAAALAPWAGAALAERLGSYGAAFLVLAGLNAAAVALTAGARAPVNSG
jgi:MFS family permease